MSCSTCNGSLYQNVTSHFQGKPVPTILYKIVKLPNPNPHKHTEQHNRISHVLSTRPAQIFWTPSIISKLHAANDEPPLEKEQRSQTRGHNLARKWWNGWVLRHALCFTWEYFEQRSESSPKPTLSSSRHRSQYYPVGVHDTAAYKPLHVSRHHD